MKNYESQFEIGQEVTFIPTMKDCMNYFIEDEELTGQVVSVKFTKSKVFYDIVDEYYGRLFELVDSANISEGSELENIIKNFKDEK